MYRGVLSKEFWVYELIDGGGYVADDWGDNTKKGKEIFLEWCHFCCWCELNDKKAIEFHAFTTIGV